jgi:hypothetical protein
MAMNDVRLNAPIDISLEASMPLNISQAALAIEVYLEAAELDGNARAGLVRLHAGLTREIEKGWDRREKEPGVEVLKSDSLHKKKTTKKRKKRKEHGVE